MKTCEVLKGPSYGKIRKSCRKSFFSDDANAAYIACLETCGLCPSSVSCDSLIPDGTAALIGDSCCNGGSFNTTTCGNDEGDCGKESSAAPPHDGTITEDLFVEDVNGDGLLDIVLGNYGYNEVLLQKSNATDICFHDTIEIPGSFKYTRAIALADMNNDGRPAWRWHICERARFAG